MCTHMRVNHAPTHRNGQHTPITRVTKVSVPTKADKFLEVRGIAVAFGPKQFKKGQPCRPSMMTVWPKRFQGLVYWTIPVWVRFVRAAVKQPVRSPEHGLAAVARVVVRGQRTKRVTPPEARGEPVCYPCTATVPRCCCLAHPQL